MHALPLRTRSLLLRHFAAADTAPIMALNAEPTTSRWLPSHVYTTAEEAAAAMAYLAACYESPGHPARGPYVLGVEHRESGRLLGHVGFSPLDGEVEVSYAIAQDSRGLGYGTEALVHACLWVARTYRVTRLVANTAEANTPSRRVLERASFVHVLDEDAMFQGRPERISRYRWNANTHDPGPSPG